MARFTDLADLFEASGFELVRTSNGLYKSKIHNSLIVRGANCPRFPNTFYWNSQGIKGGFGAAKKLLRDNGHITDSNFVPTKKETYEPKNTVSKESRDRKISTKNKGVLTSNFHSFCRKLGITDALLKKMSVGSYESFGTVKTVFNSISVHNTDLGFQAIEYLKNGKRNKENNFSLYTAKFEAGCFGEHLVNEKSIIGIVEAPKTAVILSHFYPQITWLAMNGANGLYNLAASHKRIIEKFPNARFLGIFADFDKAGLNIDTSESIGYKMPLYVVKSPKKIGYDLADFIIDSKNENKPFSANIQSIVTRKENLSFYDLELLDKGFIADLGIDLKTKNFTYTLHENHISNDSNCVFLLEKYWANHQKIFLKAATNLGKSTLSRNVLIANELKKGHRVIYATPTLATVKSFSNEFKDSKIADEHYIAIQASETGDFVGNSEVGNANLTISTFEGLKKLDKELDFLNNENFVLIIDECHKVEFLPKKVFSSLKNSANKILLVSATPQGGLVSFLGFSKFEIKKGGRGKKCKIFDCENPLNSIIDQLLKYDFDNQKVYCPVQTISDIEYITEILIAQGTIKKDNVLVMTSENRNEWGEVLTTKLIPNDKKLVLSTSVFEVGTDLYNLDFNDIFICDSTQFPISAESNSQSDSRFRKKQPNVTIFRKDKKSIGKSFEQIFNTNLKIVSLQKNTIDLSVNANQIISQACQKNDSELSLLTISKFLDSNNEIDVHALFLYSLEIFNRNATNEQMAGLMSEYADYDFSFEKYEFAKKEVVESDLSALRKVRKSKIDANLNFQKEVLIKSENLEDYEAKIVKIKESLQNAESLQEIPRETEPIIKLHSTTKDFDTAKELALKHLGGAAIKKRIEAFQKFDVDFDTAKELVSHNFSEVEFSNEKIRQTVKYLLRTETRLLSQKQNFEKGLILEFKQSIDLTKEYSARELNDMFVDIHKRNLSSKFFASKSKNPLLDRYGKLIYEALDIVPIQKQIPKGAFTKSELLEMGINPKRDLKGVKYEYKTVTVSKKSVKKYFIE